MLLFVVLAQRLAMIAKDDDDRAIETACCREVIDQVRNVTEAVATSSLNSAIETLPETE